jgi:hypothetical protein
MLARRSPPSKPWTKARKPTRSPTLERQPSQATRRMGKRRHAKRGKIKPFIKTINHLMPTRYTLELEGPKGLLVPVRPRRRNRAPPRQKSLVKGREQEGLTVTQVRKSLEPKCLAKCWLGKTVLEPTFVTQVRKA